MLTKLLTWIKLYFNEVTDFLKYRTKSTSRVDNDLEMSRAGSLLSTESSTDYEVDYDSNQGPLVRVPSVPKYDEDSINEEFYNSTKGGTKELVLNCNDIDHIINELTDYNLVPTGLLSGHSLLLEVRTISEDNKVIKFTYGFAIEPKDELKIIFNNDELWLFIKNEVVGDDESTIDQWLLIAKSKDEK
jgi:hypothetical protein